LGKVQETITRQNSSGGNGGMWLLALAIIAPCLTVVWLISRLPTPEEQARAARLLVSVVTFGPFVVLLLKVTLHNLVEWKKATMARTVVGPAPKRVAQPKRQGQAEEWLQVVEGKGDHARRNTLG
jgi:hypothetical protein